MSGNTLYPTYTTDKYHELYTFRDIEDFSEDVLGGVLDVDLLTKRFNLFEIELDEIGPITGADILPIQRYVKKRRKEHPIMGADDATTKSAYITSFRDYLQDCIHSLHRAETDSSAPTHTYEFNTGVLSSGKQVTEKVFERDIQYLQTYIDTIEDTPDREIRCFEFLKKQCSIVTSTSTYLLHQIGKQIGKKIGSIDRVNLATPRKILIAATMMTYLLFGGKSKPTEKSLPKIEHLLSDEKIWTDPLVQEKIFSITSISLATPTKPSTEKHTKETAHQVERTLKETPKIPREKIRVVPLEKPIPSPINSLYGDLRYTTIKGYTIGEEMITHIFYRKPSPGQTLGQLREVLLSDTRFAYLADDRYDPTKTGNVLSRNIPAGKITPGSLIPIPLEQKETFLSQKELIRSTHMALDQVRQHERYGGFVKHLETHLGRNHLVKVMIAFAQKESNQGATSMYRYEPAYKAFSFGLYHILTEKTQTGNAGPGLEALQELGYTAGEVMSDPAKAGQRFRAYRYEKIEELKYSKNKERKHFAEYPEKLFRANHLDDLGKIYNGSQEYGKALQDLFKQIGKKK